MSVNPGFSYQSFLPDAIGRVREVRHMLDELKSPAHLQVDGGVSPDNIAQAGGGGRGRVRQRELRLSASAGRRGRREGTAPGGFRSGQGAKYVRPRQAQATASTRRGLTKAEQPAQSGPVVLSRVAIAATDRLRERRRQSASDVPPHCARNADFASPSAATVAHRPGSLPVGAKLIARRQVLSISAIFFERIDLIARVGRAGLGMRHVIVIVEQGRDPPACRPRRPWHRPRGCRSSRA